MKRNIGAYMTLEASAVLPFIFMILLLSFYMAIYVYDSVIFSQDIYSLALKASGYDNYSKREVMETIEVESIGLKERPYISFGAITLDTEVRDRFVTIRGRMEFLFPFRGVLPEGIFAMKHTIETEKTVRRENIQYLMRMTDKLSGKLNESKRGLYNEN